MVVLLLDWYQDGDGAARLSLRLHGKDERLTLHSAAVSSHWPPCPCPASHTLLQINWVVDCLAKVATSIS